MHPVRAGPYRARHALQATREMQRTMKALQPEFEHEGWPPLGVEVRRNGGLMNGRNNAQQIAMTTLRDAALFVVTGIAGLSSTAIHN